MQRIGCLSDMALLPLHLSWAERSRSKRMVEVVTDLQDLIVWPPIDRIPVHSNKALVLTYIGVVVRPSYKVSAVQMKVVKGSDPSRQNRHPITISLKIKNIGLKASSEKAFLQVFEEGILRLPSQTFKAEVKIGEET